MPKSKPWTQEQDNNLRNLFTAGWKDTAIATQMRRNPDAIRQRRHVIGAVKFTKKPYKQKNKRPAKKRGRYKGPAGAQAPLFNFDRAINQPEGKLPIKGLDSHIEGFTADQKVKGMAVSVRETIAFDSGIAPGSLVFFASHGQVDMQARGLTPRQVAKILAAFISKIV